MTVMQLTGGRETYGPNVPSGPGVSPLWQYIKGPPAEKSIIIFPNGLVVQRANPSTRDMVGAHTVILGGTDFRCEDTSFAYSALVAAGFEFTALPDQDVTEDTVRDSATLEWSTPQHPVVE